MPGVSGRFPGHVRDHPPEGTPLTVDRTGHERGWIADRANGSVAVIDRRAVVPQHFRCAPFSGDDHAEVAVRLRYGLGEVMAEPIPLANGQVLNQAQDRDAAVNQDAAQLLLGQPVGLLHHALPSE